MKPRWDRSCHRYPCSETDRIDQVLNDLELETVHLNPNEIQTATAAGKARYHRRRTLKSKQRYGRNESDHTELLEIEAIGSEIACAKALNLEWKDSPTTDRDGDLGPGIQVRHTQYPTGRLIVHPDDDDSHVFFLVTGRFPKFRIAGWIIGSNAKQPEFWGSLQKGRPSFNIPQDKLAPLREYHEAHPVNNTRQRNHAG